MEFASAMDLVKVVGFPGVIFLVWFLYHKSQTKMMATIIDAQAQREERNFKILKDMQDIQAYHAAVLSRVEQHSLNNQFCPIVRKETHE